MNLLGGFLNLFYKKWRNRLRVTDTVDAPGTPQAIYGFPYVAESIIVSNPTAGALTIEIYDGAVLIITEDVAANSRVTILDNGYLPFHTNITIDVQVGGGTVVFTFGGYTP